MLKRLKQEVQASWAASAPIDKIVAGGFAGVFVWDVVNLNPLLAVLDLAMIAYVLWSVRQ